MTFQIKRPDEALTGVAKKDDTATKESEMSTVYLPNVTLKVGTRIVLETGEYSDLNWHGPFVVLKPFSFGEARDAAEAAVKEEDPDDNLEPQAFIASLVARGFLGQTDCLTLHIGSYGSVEF